MDHASSIDRSRLRRRTWTEQGFDHSSRSAVLLGAVAVLAAVVTIWIARLQTAQTVYVSQLGAAGMPTAPVFNAALLVLGIGGVLVGVGCRGHRAAVRGLAAWSTATTLTVAGSAFVVASRVTCTAGCPVPLTPESTPQDLVHVLFAVLGFAAASWTMLQVAWADDPRPLRTLSRIAAVAVAVVAMTGGLLSVLQLRTDVGAALEFVAMTIAVLWLAGFAGWWGLRSERPRHGDTAPVHR